MSLECFRFPTDVRGWLSEEEGYQLARLAEDTTVLEIGSFAGRSTICMAQTARVVHSLDWHRGGDGLGEGPVWTLPEMLDNVHRYGLQDKVVGHVGRTEDVARVLPAGFFGLVFIDGAHDHGSVKLDTQEARRLVGPGGILAWHDWNYPAVQSAVTDVLGKLKVETLGGTLAWRAF